MEASNVCARIRYTQYVHLCEQSLPSFVGWTFQRRLLAEDWKQGQQFGHQTWNADDKEKKDAQQWTADNKGKQQWEGGNDSKQSWSGDGKKADESNKQTWSGDGQKGDESDKQSWSSDLKKAEDHKQTWSADNKKQDDSKQTWNADKAKDGENADEASGGAKVTKGHGPSGKDHNGTPYYTSEDIANAEEGTLWENRFAMREDYMYPRSFPIVKSCANIEKENFRPRCYKLLARDMKRCADDASYVPSRLHAYCTCVLHALHDA